MIPKLVLNCVRSGNCLVVYFKLSTAFGIQYFVWSNLSHYFPLIEYLHKDVFDKILLYKKHLGSRKINTIRTIHSSIYVYIMFPDTTAKALD